MRYVFLDSEPIVIKRRTACTKCGKELAKDAEAVRGYFAAAYYTHQKTHCPECLFPDEIEE